MTEIKTISAKDFDTEALFDFCIKSSDPIIITDLFDRAPSFSDWNPEKLKETLNGDSKILIRRSKSSLFDYKAGSEEMCFRDFFELLTNQATASDSDRVYMQQQQIDNVFPELYQYMEFKKIVPEGVVNFKNLWLGLGGNISALHFDPYNNFFVQLFSKKNFYLFSPAEYGKLYSHGTFSTIPYVSRFDPQKPDYKKFPKAQGAKYLLVTAEPGSILYIPSYWWHQVESIPGSLNISLNIWLNSGPFKLVRGFLHILPMYLLINTLKTIFKVKKFFFQVIKSSQQQYDVAQ